MIVRFAFFIAFCSLVSPALGQKRIALLIGNQDYRIDSLDLKNPHNDVAAVGKALRQVGFNVRIVRDAGFGRLQKEVNRYTKRLRAAGKDAVGFFYYSGHGALNEQDRYNYLIPTDVDTVDSTDLWDGSVRLKRIINDLKDKASNAVHFVVFDACRNELKLASKGSRSLRQSKGFKPVQEQVQGMLIAYATAEGEIATDVGEKLGPYAEALAKAIVKPGLEAVTMFRQVQVSVLNNVGQEPWYTHGALRPVYFAGERVRTRPPSSVSPAGRDWQFVKDTNNSAALRAFARRYKGTVFADMALAMAEALEKQHRSRTDRPSSQEKPIQLFHRSKPSDFASADEARKFIAQPHVWSSCKELDTAYDRIPSGPTLSLSFDVLDRMKELKCNNRAKSNAIAFSNCLGINVKHSTGKTACIKPGSGKSFKDCDICPEMVVVPAGNFLMGSYNGDSDERPFRKVTIGAPIAIGKFEVTFAQWDACAADGSCKLKPSDQGWGRGSRPIVNVSWHDINNQYLPWLSWKTSRSYRLLTEAEWEYAARAGTTERWSFGDDERAICEFANHADKSTSYDFKNKRCSDGIGHRTAQVGRYKPNPWGLYDVHGNVKEWVQDCYMDSFRGAPMDGSAVTTGKCSYRVIRGGAWDNYPPALRLANRVRLPPVYRSPTLGFRVARDLTPAKN